MPRPLLMPLSGGYRRTPVLQIGANVYSDTKIIALGLARVAADQTLFAHGFAAHRVADWADSQLFRVGVALNFRPEAVAAQMGRFTPEEQEAFVKDRAELSGDQPIVGLSESGALGYLEHAAQELDQSLADRAFLFGATPCIADFSVFHNIWFLRNHPVNAPLLDPYEHLLAWYARMLEFGHGDVTVSDGGNALQAAKEATPELPAGGDTDPRIGQVLATMPVDYGRNPVSGVLKYLSTDEIILERSDDACGTVYNHFPRAGFEITSP